MYRVDVHSCLLFHVLSGLFVPLLLKQDLMSYFLVVLLDLLQRNQVQGRQSHDSVSRWNFEPV